MADFKGDGGPALAAAFLYPTGIAIDSQDNIYVADGGNSRVRKIDKFGKIITVAWTGEPGLSGDRSEEHTLNSSHLRLSRMPSSA